MPVDVRPKRSSSVDVQPFLKCLYQLLVCVWPKLLSPKACFNIWCVSAAVFPSLKQNFIPTRCSLRLVIATPQTHKPQEHNNGNMFINNKPNHPNSMPLVTLIQEGCVGKDACRYFDVLITTHAKKIKFR
jgi:hypothetical protein